MHQPTSFVDDLDLHVHGHPGPQRSGLTRRQWLRGSAAQLGIGLAGGCALAHAQDLAPRPTAEEILGPFYPASLPIDQDADLTAIARQGGRALGQVIYLSGRVMNRSGAPVADAEIEVWQANAAGRYTHPADTNPAAVDPAFKGYARIRTGPDGGWRIKTIRPGAYPVAQVPGWTRPPHIHFDIRGKASRLVTQMYFEGETLNERDLLLRRTPSKDTLIAKLSAAPGDAEAGALAALWNIVLIAG